LAKADEKGFYISEPSNIVGKGTVAISNAVIQPTEKFPFYLKFENGQLQIYDITGPPKGLWPKF